jgi:tryptophanyl-tRNA synthetase
MGSVENSQFGEPKDHEGYEHAIGEQRDIINGIDAWLIPLLRQRAEAAQAIGLIKAKHGMPIFVGAREQQVIDRACEANGKDSPLPDGDVANFMRGVMKTSRAAQQASVDVDSDNRVITGFRPTSNLTIGNYLGAVRPSLELQDDPDKELYIFVADLHGLTDSDPRDIAEYRHAVAHDLIALGIDPQRSTLYMQSDIEDSVVEIANRVGPHINVGTLSNTPSIKDKVKEAVRKGTIDHEDIGSANFALLGYPVLMAADIYAQHANSVPVGNDQDAHLELARQMARRFNRRFDKDILVEPRNLVLDSLRILSLDGEGKMSKSNPDQAIILTEDPEHSSQKIKGATTANSGEWNDTLTSHFLVAESTAKTEEEKHALAEIKAAHKAGKPVMRQFKQVWGTINSNFLEEFQTAKAAIHEADTISALRYGADRAERNARVTLSNMKEAMGF